MIERERRGRIDLVLCRLICWVKQTETNFMPTQLSVAKVGWTLLVETTARNNQQWITTMTNHRLLQRLTLVGGVLGVKVDIASSFRTTNQLLFQDRVPLLPDSWMTPFPETHCVKVPLGDGRNREILFAIATKIRYSVIHGDKDIRDLITDVGES